MNKRLLCLMFCLLGLVVSGQSAALPALSFSGGYDTANPSGDVVYGWEFEVFADTNVDALGFFDFGGDGLIESHDIGLWNSSGDLLASVTIPAGNATTLIDGFRYVDIADVLLGVDAGYIIGATNIDIDRMIADVDSVSTLPTITWVSSRFGNTGGVLARPELTVNRDAYFGPNFLISRVGTVPVPAPLALIGFALAALGMLRRKPSA